MVKILKNIKSRDLTIDESPVESDNDSPDDGEINDHDSEHDPNDDIDRMVTHR